MAVVDTQYVAPDERIATPPVFPEKHSEQNAVSTRPHRKLQTPPKLASVAELFNGASSGDEAAWAQLVCRYNAMIASVGRRFGLCQADVNELQQTTWLRLVENFDRIEQPERVGGWLATTARRESLHMVNRASRSRTGVDDMLADLPDSRASELDARPLAEERNVALRAAWARLKPRCQELLSLLISEDAIAYKDLSELLRMPVGSIGPTRMRCLEHLRRLVAEEGLTEL